MPRRFVYLWGNVGSFVFGETLSAPASPTGRTLSHCATAPQLKQARTYSLDSALSSGMDRYCALSEAGTGNRFMTDVMSSARLPMPLCVSAKISNTVRSSWSSFMMQYRSTAAIISTTFR